MFIGKHFDLLALNTALDMSPICVLSITGHTITDFPIPSVGQSSFLCYMCNNSDWETKMPLLHNINVLKVSNQLILGPHHSSNYGGLLFYWR